LVQALLERDGKSEAAREERKPWRDSWRRPPPHHEISPEQILHTPSDATLKGFLRRMR
jgi:hypothetical protein